MPCQSCLERSLQDTQRALTKERSLVVILKTVLKDLKPYLPPEQQKQVDEVLSARLM